MRRVAVFVAVFALVVAFAPASRASADPGGEGHASGVSDPLILAIIGDDDLFSLADLSTVLNTAPTGPQANGTQHYGPFTSTSPDSGTCNDWAEDTFDRHFTVRASGLNTFTVVEQFKNGSFVTTLDGPSPGGCDTDLGGTIVTGKTGSMHGYEIITVTGTQTSSEGSCVANTPSAPCTTAGFIGSHFAGSSTVGTYFFHYAAGDQNLAVHEWKNASCDRGGNAGDIASTTGVQQRSPLCP